MRVRHDETSNKKTVIAHATICCHARKKTGFGKILCILYKYSRVSKSLEYKDLQIRPDKIEPSPYGIRNLSLYPVDETNHTMLGKSHTSSAYNDLFSAIAKTSLFGRGGKPDAKRPGEEKSRRHGGCVAEIRRRLGRREKRKSG